MKRIAVVTGASSGLGREYVKLMDERLTTHPKEKLDEIWVIARRKDRLEALQGDVRIPLRVIPLDLTSPSFESEIRHLYETEKPDIAFLINAAGFGKIGSYADISEQDAGRMVDLNCRAIYERRGTDPECLLDCSLLLLPVPWDLLCVKVVFISVLQGTEGGATQAENFRHGCLSLLDQGYRVHTGCAENGFAFLYPSF